MKLGQLLGVGILVSPVAFAGLAEAQTKPKPPAPKPVEAKAVEAKAVEAKAPESKASESKSYVSFAAGAISGADYSYDVEDFFPVEAEMGDGYIIEAAYGMRIDKNWRGELAFSWRDHNNATTTWQFGSNLTGPGLSAYTLDAIGYYDFRPDSRANFYLGVGLGIGSMTIDDGVIADSTGSGLHLQAIAGVEGKVSDSVKVFAEARVRSMRPTVETGTAGASGGAEDDFDITSTSIQAGFKILL